MEASKEYQQFLIDFKDFCHHDCDRPCEGYGAKGDCPYTFENRDEWLVEEE